MRTPTLPVLDTPRLTLRPFVAADAERVQLLLSDRRISDGTLRIPYPYPDGAAAAWIATHDALWASGKMATWAITQRDGGVLVGALSLHITAAHRRAEAGYWVAPEVWGQGVATEALRAAVAFGFDTLDLYRIEAHHYVENPSSGRVMAKVGMKHEGRLRGPVFREGVPRDLDLLAIVRTDPRG